MRVDPPRLLIAAILGALALPVAAQEWAGTGRAEGTVTSADGRPLAGARVTFHLLDDRGIAPPPLTTDSRGAFSLVGLRGGNWVVRADADDHYADIVLAGVADTGVSPAMAIVLQPVPREERYTEARVRAYQLLEKGDELATAGRLPDAREQYEKALAELEPPAQGVALAAIAVTYVEEGNLEEARKLLEKALAIDPSQKSSLGTLAAIMAARGRARQAAEVLAILGKDEPVAGATLIGIAVTYYNRGQPADAKPFLDRAIAQDAGAGEAYYFRGLVGLSLGDTAAARADLEAYLKREPDGTHAADAAEYLGYLQADARGK